MANCSNCGSPLGEGQTFCGGCGQAVAAVNAAAGAPPVAQAAYAVPPQPQYQAPPAPGVQPPAYPAPGGYGPGAWQPPRKSRKGLWIALAALLVALVVACVLVFVVFWDKISGDGGGTGPEKAVQKLLTAMENKDVDGFFALVDPASMEQLTAMGMSLDAVKAMFADEIFAYESMKFSNVKMETEDTGESTATVRIVEGTVSITEDGKTETEDVVDSDEPVEFDLIQQDGKWYVDPETMF